MKSRAQLLKRVKYGRVDHDVVPHPLVAGHAIEFFLRHLANDPKSTTTIRGLAKSALTGNGKPEGASEALYMLHDALQEQSGYGDDSSASHPMNGVYNLMSAADKVHLDQHTYTALKEEGDKQRRESDTPNDFTNWRFTPEGQAIRRHAIRYIQPERDREGSQFIENLHKRIKKLSGEEDSSKIEKSLRRHHYRAAMGYNIEDGNTRLKEDYRKAALEKVPEEYENGRFEVDKSLHATRYKRVRYAKPEIPEPKKPNLTELGRRTRERILGSKPKKVIITEPKLELPRSARQAVPIAKLKASKYAKSHRGDFLDSLRRINSSNQKALHTTANMIAKKLGIEPITIKDALHDTPQGATPGIAQAIYGNASPESVHSAAAWLGLTANIPGVSVFHPRENGPDTLYKFEHYGSGIDLRHKLDKYGITQRVLIPTKTGFSVVVPDKGNRLGNSINQYITDTKSELERTPGHLSAIGSADQARARDIFRNKIVKQESNQPQQRMKRKGLVRKYMMSDGEGLIRAAVENRGEHTPSLAYADWLYENHDDPASAQLIRDAVTHAPGKGGWVAYGPPQLPISASEYRVNSEDQTPGYHLSINHPNRGIVTIRVVPHYTMGQFGEEPTGNYHRDAIMYGRDMTPDQVYEFTDDLPESIRRVIHKTMRLYQYHDRRPKQIPKEPEQLSKRKFGREDTTSSPRNMDDRNFLVPNGDYRDRLAYHVIPNGEHIVSTIRPKYNGTINRWEWRTHQEGVHRYPTKQEMVSTHGNLPHSGELQFVALNPYEKVTAGIDKAPAPPEFNLGEDNPMRASRKLAKRKSPIKVYRGISPESGTKSYRQGKGLYMTTSPSIASQYGEVKEIPLEHLPKKPLKLKSEEDWDGWLVNQYVNKLGMKNIREFSSKYPDPGEYVKSLGYDGVRIGDGGLDTTYVSYKAPIEWSTLNREKHKGEIVDIDNGTGIVKKANGKEVAVRLLQRIKRIRGYQ